MSRSGIAFVLVLAVAACGGSHKNSTNDPGTGTGSASASSVPTIDTSKDIPAALAKKVDRVFAFMDALMTAAESAVPDCSKMAAKMQAVVDGPDGSAVKDIVADPDYPKYAEEIDSQYSDKSNEMDQRVKNVQVTCFQEDASGNRPAGSEDVWNVLVKAGLAGGEGDTDGDTDEGGGGMNE